MHSSGDSILRSSSGFYLGGKKHSCNGLKLRISITTTPTPSPYEQEETNQQDILQPIKKQDRAKILVALQT